MVGQINVRDDIGGVPCQKGGARPCVTLVAFNTTCDVFGESMATCPPVAATGPVQCAAAGVDGSRRLSEPAGELTRSRRPSCSSKASTAGRCDETAVGLWRRRFLEAGLEGLYGRPRWTGSAPTRNAWKLGSSPSPRSHALVGVPARAWRELARMLGVSAKCRWPGLVGRRAQVHGPRPLGGLKRSRL